MKGHPTIHTILGFLAELAKPVSVKNDPLRVQDEEELLHYLYKLVDKYDDPFGEGKVRKNELANLMHEVPLTPKDKTKRDDKLRELLSQCDFTNNDSHTEADLQITVNTILLRFNSSPTHRGYGISCLSILKMTAPQMLPEDVAITRSVQEIRLSQSILESLPFTRVIDSRHTTTYRMEAGGLIYLSKQVPEFNLLDYPITLVKEDGATISAEIKDLEIRDNSISINGTQINIDQIQTIQITINKKAGWFVNSDTFTYTIDINEFLNFHRVTTDIDSFNAPITFIYRDGSTLSTEIKNIHVIESSSRFRFPTIVISPPTPQAQEGLPLSSRLPNVDDILSIDITLRKSTEVEELLSRFNREGSDSESDSDDERPFLGFIPPHVR